MIIEVLQTFRRLKLFYIFLFYVKEPEFVSNVFLKHVSIFEKSFYGIRFLTVYWFYLNYNHAHFRDHKIAKRIILKVL